MKKASSKIDGDFIETLQRKERQLQALIQSDKRVFIYLSPAHKILEFNREAERVYGLRREEVLGKDYFTLFLPKSKWKKAAERIKKVLAGVPVTGFEDRVVSSDLRETLLSWHVVQVLGFQGIAVGILASGLDITEIRRHRDDLYDIVKKCTLEINAAVEILRPKIVDRKYAETVLRKISSPKDSASKKETAPFIQIDTRGTIIALDPQAERTLKTLKTKIRERRHAEAVLKKTTLPKDLNPETSAVPFIQMDVNGTIIYWDEQAERSFGWSRKEALGRLLSEMIVPSRLRAIRNRSLQDFLSMGEGALFKRMLLSAEHRSGKEFPVEMVFWATKIGTSYLFNVFVQGIAAQTKAEKREYLAESVINAANEAIIMTDVQGNIFSVNPAFSRITGYAAEEVIGKNPRMLASGRHDKFFYQEMWEQLTNNGHWGGEIWNRRKNGEIYPEWLSITVVKDMRGAVMQYVGFFIDISRQKEDTEKLYHRAHYDALTGLPNRTLFNERLLQIIRMTKRNRKKAALLFVDLDKFKQINDTYGHQAGDQVLNEAGKRMLSCIREADTLGRYGGDEFLIVLSDINNREDSIVVTSKIIETLSTPFQVKGHTLSISTSIGITVIPDDGEEITVLLEHADEAMYQAKALGRNRFHFFDRDQKQDARALMKSDIRRGIDNQEFVIYYQPIIDLFSSKTIALEALIRWEHPDLGFILPDQFIPLAEASGLIEEMETWVLKAACKQVKHWHDNFLYEGAISVNVSSRQMNDHDFDAVLKQALEESGLNSRCLTLEIVGNLLPEKNDQAVGGYERLKAIGVKLSIHDLGTGYASLSYLSKYPIDHLKIDQAFIQNISQDPKKISLVKAIVSMGHHLNMKVLAMGIETDQELSFLKGLGCDGGQGYFIRKPLSAKGYEAVLRKEMPL